MDWQTIGLTALVTTVGTVIVTYVGHRLTVRKDSAEERQRHATYLAVRVVCILDQFAISCCDVVDDQGVYDESGVRHTNTRTPQLTFPDDVDWRSLNPDLMYRILTLPNEVENAERAVSDTFAYAGTGPDYDEVFEERSSQFAKIGITAMDLAKDLRDAYGLAQPDYSAWNPRTTLDRVFKASEERRRTIIELAEQISAKKPSGGDK